MRVVVVFDPVGELAVEGFERERSSCCDEELVADAAEEAFDLSLGGGVADGVWRRRQPTRAQMRVISWEQ